MARFMLRENLHLETHQGVPVKNTRNFICVVAEGQKTNLFVMILIKKSESGIREISDVKSNVPVYCHKYPGLM